MKQAVILASGPSMTQEDADAVHEWRNADPETRAVIVVNTTFRLAPWADILSTNDDDWLDHHLPEIRESFLGAIHCAHPGYRDTTGVEHVPFDKDATGLASAKPGHIAWGMNSGASAISLAHFMGAQRIILLGFDQQWTGDMPRWHGRHPGNLQNQKPGFHRWAKWFVQAAIDADALGVEIINCSRATSLTCFRRMDLSEALCSQ